MAGEVVAGPADPQRSEALVEKVREKYGRIALGKDAGCCGPASACSGETAVSLEIGYRPADLDRGGEANLGLGCGAPVAALDLRAGETVLDLGSGAGLDVLLAADRVGPSGRAIGVDMTPAMVERARKNAEKAGLTHVEFREGRLEALPVADASVDAVTSNCVINLVPDKGAVFREIARVLKPGGRLVIADILLDSRLPEAIEQDLYAYVGCISGAMLRPGYMALLEAAGLGQVEVLKDVDYLAAIAGAAPEEAERLLGRHGLTLEDVAGKVRSVTYRARKASAAGGHA
jgi:SAM-dependent methyltransferase